MYLKKEEYETIKEVALLFPTGEDFEKLPEETRDTITRLDVLLSNLYKRQKASNAKTARYIAEKRKTNRNYAR